MEAIGVNTIHLEIHHDEFLSRLQLCQVSDIADIIAATATMQTNTNPRKLKVSIWNIS